MSVIPLRPGKLLIGDVQKGKPIQLGRVVSSAAMFHGFMHNIQVQIAEIIFEMPIAVAMTTAILPIFGRKEALDRFSVRFVKGQELVLDG